MVSRGNGLRIAPCRMLRNAHRALWGVAALATSFFASSDAQAQKVTFASEVNCREVAGFARAFEREARRSFGGFLPLSSKVGPLKRKTLILQRVISLSVSGCTMNTKVAITVVRPARRNGVGNASIKADVVHWNKRTGTVCVSNFRATNVKVSHTTVALESVYKTFATLPEHHCVRIAAARTIQPLQADAICAGKLRQFIGDRAMPRWDLVRRLCTGAEGSDQPAVCYQTLLSGRVSWGGGTRWRPENIVSLCQGARSAVRTIACFSGEINAGRNWRASAARCRGR